MFHQYVIIFITIFLIILFLIWIHYLFRDKKCVEKFTDSKTVEDRMDLRSHLLDNNQIQNQNQKNMPNNLIKNGSFEAGKNPLQFTNQNGYNKIINKINPGKSSYVLEQMKSPNELITYYELTCSNQKNSKYLLYFWLCVTDSNKNDIDMEELDASKLINIKIQNEDFSNDIPEIHYNIIQKIKMNKDSNSWYLMKYDFISGHNTQNKMQIYLNYSPLQFEHYYFTDLSLYRELIDAQNFIYNDGLICYMDGYSYESNSTTWHDLSGSGNDLFWSNIPIVDYTKGFINLLNYKITGFSSDLLSNHPFTILFCLNNNYENIASDVHVNEEDSQTDLTLISIPGNNRYAFEIKIKNNYLSLMTGKEETKTSNPIHFYNKCLLAIEYNNSNDTINIYLDSVIVLTKKVDKLYFSTNNITINQNKNLDINLYSLLFYNRIIERKELNDIREYFILNENKNYDSYDINKYVMTPTAQYTSNNMNIPFLKNTNDEKYYDIHNELFQNEFNNQTLKWKKRNQKQEKQEYQEEEQSYNNMNLDQNQGNCPKVYVKDGNYIVYSSTGEKSYGKNLEKAKYTYHLNYPKCVIPDELLPEYGNQYSNTCPFVINELNPCSTSACAGVNWNVSNYHDLNLSKNCKKAVSNYCQINNHLDDKCYCWNPKNKDDPKCIEYRRYFEDPNDYCSPNQFKIEEHPDFSKYIKKDSIPCWGCNLEA
jgi:hypothetical protein